LGTVTAIYVGTPKGGRQQIRAQFRRKQTIKRQQPPIFYKRPKYMALHEGKMRPNTFDDRYIKFANNTRKRASLRNNLHRRIAPIVAINQSGQCTLIGG
jgi:hypothetical protein